MLRYLLFCWKRKHRYPTLRYVPLGGVVVKKRCKRCGKEQE